MMTVFNPQIDRLADWHDPFPEPRTLPSGWDLSEFGFSRQTVAETQAPPEDEGVRVKMSA